MKKRNPISKKIKDNYGTIKHFCKVKGCHYGTFRNFLAGSFKSERYEKLLRDEGYIDE